MTNEPEDKQTPVPPLGEKPAEGGASQSGGTPPSEAASKPPAPPSTPGSAPAAPGSTPPAPGAAPAAPAKPAAAVPPKPAAAVPAKPAAPAAPKVGPVPLDNDLVKRYRARFGDGIREAWLDRNQAILVVGVDRLLEIAIYTRDEEQFGLLVDLTAVDWPKRERRFDLVLMLYSFEKNERLRIKAHVGENEPAASVESIWPTANWLEREVYDMFGIIFTGHPNLKRLLLPEEWQGFPLRKDYDILQQDEAWVRENLGIESGQ
jgi:NADH-quinone oxidoreductase subunit C